MPASTLDIPPWTPPEVTKAKDIEWAPLHTLDLSQVTGDDFTQVPESVVQEVGEAFSKDGFIYAENHGLSWDEVLRQFAIGQFAFNGVSEEDKAKYKADILRTGSFVGYKEQGHWKIDGVKDRIEQLNIGSQSYSPEARSKLFPPSIQSLLPEVEAFAKYNHQVILRKILSVLSLVLKLPADYLWNLSKDPEIKGLDLLRYAMYHTPPKEDDAALGGVRLQGHTDFNSVSILWSQPITSLEVLMPDNQWRLVKHRDNALVINLGDAMHFLSGGYLKQTIHRVVAPPADQAHYTRLGIFYFALFNDDVPLDPLVEASPLVKQTYEARLKTSPGFWDERKAQGLPVPTAGEWERLRVKAYGQMKAKKGEDGHDHEEIAGVKVTHYNGLAKTIATQIAA
ncbi:Clavaminate synthase-like protein [Violaceomyces palustris]|uniref:Clavaminate synthase-like protein n=1 Tax=Violaceomyces palustris TaxID=1673888 RepID=A0ACD0NZH8_9BASI|nr:Clavaminate synthase-like protein [Violaceomyces palustris]